MPSNYSRYATTITDYSINLLTYSPKLTSALSHRNAKHNFNEELVEKGVNTVDDDQQWIKFDVELITTGHKIICI